MSSPGRSYHNLIAASLVFIGAVFFSAKAIFVKLAYRFEVDSVSLLTLRMLFSLPVFLAAAFWGRRIKERDRKSALTTREWVQIILLGIIGYYLASLFDFLGLQYLTASLERLLLFIYPTLVVLISAMVFRQPITSTQLGALVLTYVGIAVVFSNGLALQALPHFKLGFFLIFLSALTFAIYLVGSGHLLPRIGTVRYTSLAMTSAAVAVLIHHGVTRQWQLFDFSAPVYYLALSMAILSTALPAFLVSEGIRMIGSSNASIISSVSPVSTLILAYIFLDERLDWWQWAGAVLVIFGVGMITFSRKSDHSHP